MFIKIKFIVLETDRDSVSLYMTQRRGHCWHDKESFSRILSLSF